MLKKLKNIKKKIVIADGLLLAAMAVVFGTTYDINPHIGMYVLAAELAAVAIMIVRSGKSSCFWIFWKKEAKK